MLPITAQTRDVKYGTQEPSRLLVLPRRERLTLLSSRQSGMGHLRPVCVRRG